MMFKNIAILIILGVFTTACDSETQNQLQQEVPIVSGQNLEVDGASDSGGGDVKGSTAEQVESAIYKTRDLLANDDFRKDFLHSFSEHITYSQDGAWSFQYKDNLSSILKNIEINLEFDNACTASNNDHADASVSSHSEDADICFSVFKLKRINQEDLEKHLIALWLHEVVHLYGFGEEDANYVQKTVVSNYESFAKFQIFRKFYKRLRQYPQGIQSLLALAEQQSELYRFAIKDQEFYGDPQEYFSRASTAVGMIYMELKLNRDFFEDFNKILIPNPELRECVIPVYAEHFRKNRKMSEFIKNLGPRLATEEEFEALRSLKDELILNNLFNSATGQSMFNRPAKVICESLERIAASK